MVRDPRKLTYLLRMLDRQSHMRRRRFLQIMAAAGVGALGIGSLAACNDDDDDEPAAQPGETPEPDDDDAEDSMPTEDEIDYNQVEGYEQDGRYEGRTIVVTDFGGAMRDIWRRVGYDPFSYLTGVQIIEDTSDSALLRSQVESGSVEWTVSQQGGSTGILLGMQGMLEPLDYDVIQRDRLVEGISGEHTVACLFWSTVMAYNTDEFGDSPPQGWADFWDVENFPGERGLYDWPFPNLEFALIADGVPKDEVYPLDIDRAFEVMDRIKDDILVWWEAGAQPPQLLADGELDICTAWNGRITAAQAEGQPLDIQWNEACLSFDVFTVPSGTPEREIGMDLVNFMSRPEVQARMARLIPYGPVHQDAFDHLDEATLATLPSSPELRELQFFDDMEYWIEHQDEVIERWQSWLLD
jgi:putative spermidine/putrescine transport system substrate-binding protein